MANRVNWYYRQLVSEGDMDGADDRLEQANWDLAVDTALHGVMYGLEVVEAAIPDLTVTVSGPGAAYDQTGKRIFVAANQAVDVSEDSNAVTTEVSLDGNIRIISIFIKFKRSLSNLKKDGNNVDVYYNVDESFEFIVEQSAEGIAPAPPALKSDAKLLADIRRGFGDTTITNAMIDIDRRQYVFDVTAGALEVRAGTAEEAVDGVLSALNDHITDATAAHAASAVSYAGGGAWHDGTTNAATTVELQLDKIVTDLTDAAGADRIGAAESTVGSYSVSAGSIRDQVLGLLTLLGNHIDDNSAAHAASAVSFTPAGNIGATTVQTALAELDTEKGGLALNNTWTGTNTFNSTVTCGSTLQANSSFNSMGAAYFGGGNTDFSSGTVSLSAGVRLTGDLECNPLTSCRFTISGQPFQIRCHDGDASEVLCDTKFYTFSDTFSGVSTDDLATIALTNGRTYIINLTFVGASSTGGTHYCRRTTTVAYAEAGAITIPGGIGNVESGGTLDASTPIVGISWGSTGLNLRLIVDHTGSATQVRCIAYLEFTTLKHS